MTAAAAVQVIRRGSSAATSRSGSTGPCSRRATRDMNASSVVADSTATMPRVVAARWSGPHGPAIVRTMALAGSARLHRSSVPDGPASGHWVGGCYTPREYVEPNYRHAARRVEVALPIEGMTCASCVNRIERFLRKTAGRRDATVNLATELATIVYLPDVAGRADLVGAVEAAGYEIRERPATGRRRRRARRSPTSGPPTTWPAPANRASLLVQAVVSIGVALAIMALMAAPGRDRDR